ncbi:hypothetical protein [Tengunoibacter tsumagoiensis]|uniref:Uncharacterized protein n=1 Tax=Tengunoibacter tsumagoiensis TaxID=2014871 RepID=A0A402AAI1_9CHLR|nr:hypothetical protein [Tengunoibacter tsumagoiensis]GCE16140.1 hypothetical protein KTT_59990 [Tengunoibacter tsumagoiensis]
MHRKYAAFGGVLLVLTAFSLFGITFFHLHSAYAAPSSECLKSNFKDKEQVGKEVVNKLPICQGITQEDITVTVQANLTLPVANTLHVEICDSSQTLTGVASIAAGHSHTFKNVTFANGTQLEVMSSAGTLLATGNYTLHVTVTADQVSPS